MHTLTKPLASLTAADVMTRDPVVILRHVSLRTAAHLLSRSQVTGAPVVNAWGECIGVLSATDFLHWAEGHKKPDWSKGESVCTEWQVMEPDLLPEDDVAAYMTPDPVMADQDTSLFALARMMVDAHVHRVIIVDADRRPVGIVTTTDILAALAQADTGCFRHS